MFETKFSQVSSQAPQLTSQNLPLLSCLSVPFIKVAATVITHQAVQCLLCHNNAGAFSFLQPASTGADLTRSQNQPVTILKVGSEPLLHMNGKSICSRKVERVSLIRKFIVSDTVGVWGCEQHPPDKGGWSEAGFKAEKRIQDGAPSEVWKT